LFSGFAPAFAVLCIALHVPIALALLGIVFRGAAYVFHAYGIQTEEARAGWNRVFAWASTLTPLALGAIVAAISSGAIRVHGGEVTSGYFAGWTTPFALLVGVFTLALFALLAAVYLAAETEGALADDFRQHALHMELVAAVLAALTFLGARLYAPALFANLTGSAWFWIIQALTALAGVSTFLLLAARAVRRARLTAPLQVALVVIGWGLGLRGHLILPDMTLERAAAHPEVLPGLVLAVTIGSLLVIPALGALYWVFKRSPRADSRSAPPRPALGRSR
jgi:cytochrome d ubiquinol oxidase subunit II